MTLQRPFPPARALSARRLPLLLPALAAALAPGLARATASTAAITNTVSNLTTLMTAVGIGMVTIALLFASYKMCFQAARLSDVANILLGGTMAGGAAGLAAWIFGG